MNKILRLDLTIIVLFLNRFKKFPTAGRLILFGVAASFIALFLEAIRAILKVQEGNLYIYSVGLEELCEMLFPILLIYAILIYLILLNSASHSSIGQMMNKSSKLFTPKVLRSLLLVLIFFTITALSAFGISKMLVTKDTPPPRLIEKAVRE